MVTVKRNRTGSGRNGDVTSGVGDGGGGIGDMKTSLGIGGAKTDVAIILNKEGRRPIDGTTAGCGANVGRNGKTSGEAF